MMLEPAHSVISKLGGIAQVVEATGVHRTRVYSWRRAKADRGTDGLIPQKHHPVLLDFARKRGVPLTADDFLPPHTSSEAAE